MIAIAAIIAIWRRRLPFSVRVNGTIGASWTRSWSMVTRIRSSLFEAFLRP